MKICKISLIKQNLNPKHFKQKKTKQKYFSQTLIQSITNNKPDIENVLTANLTIQEIEQAQGISENGIEPSNLEEPPQIVKQLNTKQGSGTNSIPNKSIWYLPKSAIKKLLTFNAYVKLSYFPIS